MLTRRCGVLGDPIAHSLSPALHRAAYSQLGLDWTYDAHRVASGGLGAFLAGRGDEWRGLSLTMPLKEVAYAAADELDRHASLTGAVNTLLLGETLRGFNTDVGGIVDAFTHAGVSAVRSARTIPPVAYARSSSAACRETPPASVSA